MSFISGVLGFLGMSLMWLMIIGFKLFILYWLFELVDKIVDKFFKE